MPRNPNWKRDEVILALDLYSRVNPLHTSESDPEIAKLSGLLNSLPLHAAHERNADFRNPSGVYMKLCNFLSLDPEYEGVGLKAGSRIDREVWSEFAQDRKRLRSVAAAIRKNSPKLPRPSAVDAEDEEFAEGKVLTRVHKLRERNSTLSRKKKSQMLARTGDLACEACEFSFASVYGELGDGFAECHHDKPVSELEPNEKTKLQDLSIVCANCHRMLHRARPWLTVAQLRGHLNS